MSGQGEKVQHSSSGLKPAGNGGGCIASGPFKGMMVNLGYDSSSSSSYLARSHMLH